MSHRCPDEETLAAYFDGLLPAEEEAALHRELRACPECARLIAALGMVIEVEAPAYAWGLVPSAVTQAARDAFPVARPNPLKALKLAVRWLGDQLVPADGLSPMMGAAALVRGASAGAEELRYEVTLGDLPVCIDVEVDGPARLAITVTPQTTPPPGTLLRLNAGDETRALASLTSEGATVPALPSGAYQLILERASAHIGRLEIQLGDS